MVQASGRKGDLVAGGDAERLQLIYTQAAPAPLAPL